MFLQLHVRKLSSSMRKVYLQVLLVFTWVGATVDRKSTLVVRRLVATDLVVFRLAVVVVTTGKMVAGLVLEPFSQRPFQPLFDQQPKLAAFALTS